MGFKRSVRSSIAVTVCVALIICLLVPGGLTRASTEIIREDILTISAGSGYSLAIKSDGAVWAWGSNDSGQLGNGSMESSAAPVRVSDLTEVTSVSAGYGHSLARKSDGTVRAWGYNVSGQLGNGTKNESRIPVAVSGLNEVLTISAGTFHSLALKENGSVWSWGGNYLGQLGDGTNSAKTTPVQVSSLSDVTGISAGDGHSLALKDGGTVWAWGNNYNGQLGDGTAGGEYDYDAGIDKNTPVQVWGLTGVIAISAGNSHSLALKSDGTVWAWGDNSTGQLGDGTTMDKSLPVRVRGPSNVVNISTGSNFSMALTAGGEIWAWGDNSYGQLGNGCSGGNWEYDRNIDVAIPVKLSSLSEVVAVSAGSSHSLVLKSNGTIWSWGSNTYGQLGQGIMGNKYSPVQVSDLNHISSVKAGNEISLGLKGDGTVWAWGNNLMLETGTLSHSFPKQDSGLTDVNVISTSTHTGENGCLALKNSGAIISTKTVRNWIYDSPAGWNSSLLREQVSGLSGIIDLSMGENHDLFLKDNGTVWARGSNWSGQLGDGTIEYRSSPIQIQNLSNIVSISAGENFSLAVKNNGTGWSWGANWSGQLGDGTRDT
ncbi:MAG: hypothetical protein M0P20_08400, partial [Methanocorpusculum sp.]|nr:hypothetical protein [Methanocorpusculum sp.]